MRNLFKIIDLGLIEYSKAYRIQQEVLLNRQFGEFSDTLLLAEHPPVITIGRSGSKANIIEDEDELKKRGISIFEIDRGGNVTYHGPGQLVAYPIMNIKDLTNGDIHKFLRILEEAVIRFLSHYNITGNRISNYTGVWVCDKKIASIGIGVRKWISYHGMALNINPDMSHFSMLNPCGLTANKMTSLERVLGKSISISDVKREFIESFKEVLCADNNRTKEISTVA